MGVDEREKNRDISAIIEEAESKIDKNITEEPIAKLRAELVKYPNNDRLLCCLLYGLYAASEDDVFRKAHEAEIVSIAYRIQRYSIDDNCRSEARRLLFRHYCDTNRKAEAVQIANSMARVETCFDRNMYWALEGNDRIEYLKKQVAENLKQLTWDIWAYETYAEICDTEKTELIQLRENITKLVKSKFPA